eukprot:314272-Karenia_brevis.AAC.1
MSQERKIWIWRFQKEQKPGDWDCLRRRSFFLKKVGDPKLPSQEEVREHYETGHTVFRSRCDICVRTR